jgi:Domain of Unknown Function (DUF1080)
MARNFERHSNRTLVVFSLLFAGSVYTFASGCDGSNPPAMDPPKTKSNSSGGAKESEDAKPIEKSPSKLVAPAADAKPKEQPLDPSVDVDKLLAARLPVEELSVGWIRLFDGQSMAGWRNAGNANWKVEDGVLVATEGEASLLCTSVRFSDFELTLEFKGTDKTNSGVFLRTPAVPTDPAKDCFELNIAPPDNPFPTGSLVGRAKANEQVDEPEPGEWHNMHAMVDREHIQTWVNGQLSADYMDTTGLTAGLIGLQFREGTIRFRNIKVRPISYAVLPAKDLKDFNTPAGKVEAELTSEGALTLTGGKGHIELLQPHANCCLQFAAQTLAENVNSGLFFRCIPGEDMNGYECQVHHGFKEDRRRPVDAGMGAIFRRQNAKAVLSDSSEKTFVTVIADGPLISTWVNGVQVVDFKDTREPNENPRKGLRTEAGTIMLQAHDPECKIRFDSLSICPLP